jgi:precorrin-2 dehydrogenase / sirohydrochlorin ferrochelatase
MPHAYPLVLDVTDRLIVIIGGGAVAARKAEGLIEAGAARIRVVSRLISENLPAAVERLAADYHRDHLTGAGLVFAATDDPAVNEIVVRDARAMNVLVCRVDVDEPSAAGDFITPAVIRRGTVLVTVSTGGSPALATRMRDGIETSIDERCIAMAALMQALRPAIRAALPIQIARRREIFRWLASEEALAMLHDGRGALCVGLAQKFPELSDVRW